MADLKPLITTIYSEVFVNGDLAVLDQVIDDAMVEHEDTPGFTPDKAGLANFVQALRAAFPDLSAEVVAIAQDGDEVWAQGVMRGTHRGEFMGIPATEKPIEVGFFDRIRARDDKVVEHWGLTDVMGMMQQLGVVPT